MTPNLKTTVLAISLAALSTAAFAQNNPTAAQRREAISVAVEAIGLDRDQVAKIREIRRERPPEGADNPTRRTWRQGRIAKLEALLSDDQKAKVTEIKAAGADSKAFEGAVLLGLATRQGQTRRRGGGNAN